MTIKQKRAKALGLIKRRYWRAITALAKGYKEICRELLYEECEFCDIIGRCEDCPCDDDCVVLSVLAGRCRRGELEGDDLLVAMLSLYGHLQVLR